MTHLPKRCTDLNWTGRSDTCGWHAECADNPPSWNGLDPRRWHPVGLPTVLVYTRVLDDPAICRTSKTP